MGGAVHPKAQAAINSILQGEAMTVTDQDIETLARALCEAWGFNPDAGPETVSLETAQAILQQRAAQLESAGLKVSLPEPAESLPKERPEVLPDGSPITKAWELYRLDAELMMKGEATAEAVPHPAYCAVTQGVLDKVGELEKQAALMLDLSKPGPERVAWGRSLRVLRDAMQQLREPQSAT